MTQDNYVRKTCSHFPLKYCRGRCRDVHDVDVDSVAIKKIQIKQGNDLKG